MNTANLQLEGLYAAMTALIDMLREKGVLSEAEIERTLAAAQDRIVNDPDRPPELSAANVEAISFPLRYLRVANRHSAEGRPLSFSEIARMVGQGEPAEVRAAGTSGPPGRP